MDKKSALLQYAFSLVGIPYKWGGSSVLDGLDCSGLCILLLQSVGVLPPGFDATAEGLRGRFPAVGQQAAAFGDLVLFGRDAKHATHVAFYLGDGLMIEAGGGDSTTTSLERAIEQKAYVRLSPVSRRSDCLGYVRPTYGSTP
jgi:cell wall-associated NlpC family hydrolase